MPLKRGDDMTAEDMFELCTGLFGESKSECAIWRDGFLAMLNGILAECFDLENGIREAGALEPLKEPLTVRAFGDEIDYDMSLLKTCVVWGVCALLAVSDDDNVRAGYFNNKFEVGKVYALRGHWMETEDCY